MIDAFIYFFEKLGFTLTQTHEKEEAGRGRSFLNKRTPLAKLNKFLSAEMVHCWSSRALTKGLTYAVPIPCNYTLLKK